MSADDTRDQPGDDERDERDDRPGDGDGNGEDSGDGNGEDSGDGNGDDSGEDTGDGNGEDSGEDEGEERPIDRDPIDFGAGTPMLEWVMAGVGALLAVALLTGLMIDGMGSRSGTGARSGPPEFLTTIVEVTDQGDATLLSVEVTNVGDRAVTDVMVRAEQDGTDLAEAQVQHLPHGATETIGLLIGPDVPIGEVQLRVVGYLEP